MQAWRSGTPLAESMRTYRADMSCPAWWCEYPDNCNSTKDDRGACKFEATKSMRTSSPILLLEPARSKLIDMLLQKQ